MVVDVETLACVVKSIAWSVDSTFSVPVIGSTGLIDVFSIVVERMIFSDCSVSGVSVGNGVFWFKVEETSNFVLLMPVDS